MEPLLPTLDQRTRSHSYNLRNSNTDEKVAGKFGAAATPTVPSDEILEAEEPPEKGRPDP